MIFQDVQIGSGFRWRGSTWTKTDATHAVNADRPGNEGPEHVPSHDEVKTDTTTEPTEDE